MLISDILGLLIIAIMGFIGFIIGKYVSERVILPILIEKATKEIEKNPEWIVSRLNERYYGFSDIDIITVEGPIDTLPRFRLSKKKKDEGKLELLISNNTSIDEIDEIAKLALHGKIYICYNITTPNKPAYWLSILLYLLDGGDIEIKEKDKKPIDVFYKI